MLSGEYAHMLPVYPLIAQQILDDYGINSGICLDIGTGPGYLGIELAKITDLEMYFVDLDPKALEKAEKNLSECKLDNVIHLTGADVCALPFEDDFADLVTSRGSLWFWDDQVKGLQEIYRVLKPGGIAFVGGGLGRYTPASMRRRLKGKSRRNAAEKGKARFLDGDGMKDLIIHTGLTGCRQVSDVEGEGGTWIEMRKPPVVAGS
jgi:SAM-dependent methyltransferase